MQITQREFDKLVMNLAAQQVAKSSMIKIDPAYHMIYNFKSRAKSALLAVGYTIAPAIEKEFD